MERLTLDVHAVYQPSEQVLKRAALFAGFACRVIARASLREVVLSSSPGMRSAEWRGESSNYSVKLLLPMPADASVCNWARGKSNKKRERSAD
ncbi:hypothetical protein LAD67_11605 [Escherichia coli]|nr:hypothetical protein [Escherichia coli]